MRPARLAAAAIWCLGLLAAAAGGDSAGAVLDAAGAWRGALAEAVACRAREVALATLSGATAVEIAVVGRDGDFLARAGAEPGA